MSERILDMGSKRKIKNILLGNTLKSIELEGEKLGPFWGVPIMASDAVSSVAYAIEEMLLVLVPVLGLSAVHYLGYVTSPIILLFLVLAFSYSQIIANYPNGGGAYIVSAENIGRGASMVAASSLIIGYVMTVAVSLSAATAALISAFPEFADYRLLFALLFLCIVTLLNLRGMRESSKLFGIPTYAFIVIMLALIVTGFAKLITGNLPPVHYPDNLQTVSGGAGTVYSGRDHCGHFWRSSASGHFLGNHSLRGENRDFPDGHGHIRAWADVLYSAVCHLPYFIAGGKYCI